MSAAPTTHSPGDRVGGAATRPHQRLSRAVLSLWVPVKSSGMDVVGWIAARPFSGGDCGKQTFVHLMGQGANRPFLGGEQTGRFWAPGWRKRTLVQLDHDGSYAPKNGRVIPHATDPQPAIPSGVLPKKEAILHALLTYPNFEGICRKAEMPAEETKKF